MCVGVCVCVCVCGCVWVCGWVGVGVGGGGVGWGGGGGHFQNGPEDGVHPEMFISTWQIVIVWARSININIDL